MSKSPLFFSSSLDRLGFPHVSFSSVVNSNVSEPIRTPRGTSSGPSLLTRRSSSEGRRFVSSSLLPLFPSENSPVDARSSLVDLSLFNFRTVSSTSGLKISRSLCKRCKDTEEERFTTWFGTTLSSCLRVAERIGRSGLGFGRLRRGRRRGRLREETRRRERCWASVSSFDGLGYDQCCVTLFFDSCVMSSRVVYVLACGRRSSLSLTDREKKRRPRLWSARRRTTSSSS